MSVSDDEANRTLDLAVRDGGSWWVSFSLTVPDADLSPGSIDEVGAAYGMSRIELPRTSGRWPSAASRYVMPNADLAMGTPTANFVPMARVYWSASTAGTAMRSARVADYTAIAGVPCTLPPESQAIRVGANVVIGGSGPIGGPPVVIPPTPPTTPGTRFPGDPGAGMIWYGQSSATGSASARETQLSHTVGLARVYGTTGESVASLIAKASDNLAAGRLPWLSAKVPSNNWANVADGTADAAWLDPLLDGLMALSGPVWLCLHHEPYDNLGGGNTRATYVEMHRRVKGKVTGANVAVVPILQSAPFTPSTTNGHPKDVFDNWYAHDACDVVGLDTYNHAYWEPPGGGDLMFNKWREPAVCFGESWGLVQQFSRPVAFAEYGVRTDYTDPGRSGTWMTDAFEWAMDHEVVGMSYFDSDRNVNDGDPDQEPPPWDLDHGGTVTSQILETIGNGYPNGAERLDAYATLLADSRVAYL